MAVLKTTVFDRTGSDTMTRNAFYLVIGAVLAWGFIATSMVAEMTAAWQPTIWEYLGWGLCVPILGILLSCSGNAALSFVGFNMVVVPFGAILGPVLAQAELSSPGVVGEAARLTGIVTAIMATTGLLFPNFYRGLGGALFMALLCLLAVGILQLIFPVLMQFTVIHYIAAGIFALYIGYDMWRASTVPATLDNAVDVSISLYLDIINLFIRLLYIYLADD